MAFLRLMFGFLAVLTPFAHAASSVTDAQMEDMLNAGGAILADKWAPIWMFAESQGYPGCLPTWAFGGRPNQNNGDNYAPDYQTPGASACFYPNVNCGCRISDTPKGTKSPDFPVYYTYNRCSDNEVRVSYNLFYEKDGAYWFFVQTGHPYDWENVIVSITRDDRGDWTPTSLLLGGHGSWWANAWTDLYTVAPSEIGDNMLHQKTNNDHPKVYVSWSKHANFPDPDPERLLNLPFPYQSTCNAVRAQDWWNHVNLANYIRADMSTEAGQWIQKTSWGGADSTPVKVHEGIGLCNIVGHPTCSEWKDAGGLR